MRAKIGHSATLAQLSKSGKLGLFLQFYCDVIMTNLNQIILEAIKLILAGVIGGLIGARANDRLTRNRERDAGVASRRREFLGFIAGWRSEMEKGNSIFTIADRYEAQARQARQLAEAMMDDFGLDSGQFAELVNACCRLNMSSIKNQGAASQFYKDLNTLYDYIRKR